MLDWRHIMQIPRSPTECKWLDCYEVFPNDTECFHHVKEAHIVSRRAVKCFWADCGKTSSTKWNLISHIRRHLVVPHSYCHLCNLTFTRGDDSKRHFRGHSQQQIEFNKVVEFLFKSNNCS